MKPGSVLFMPRGTWHYTEAGEGSLSVSIIVRTPAAFECASNRYGFVCCRMRPGGVHSMVPGFRPRSTRPRWNIGNPDAGLDQGDDRPVAWKMRCLRNGMKPNS